MKNDDFSLEDLRPKGSQNDYAVVETIDRVLERPKLNFLKIILLWLLTIALSIALGFAIKAILQHFLSGDNALLHLPIVFLVSLLSVLIVIVVKLKKILIWFVKVYQRFASESTRLRCVFIPSCSEYMILAIEKYGAIKGVIRGIKRLKRCHLPNGGVDNP